MEHLIDLENIDKIIVPGLVNAPESIEIQIEYIQEEFDLILPIKDKITLWRQYAKIKDNCEGISTELPSKVHRLEMNIEDMAKKMQVSS
jgi:hypothetical protein